MRVFAILDPPMPDSLDCWIYKSPRKDEMYLYLAAEKDFECVPQELLSRFGAPRLVMQLTLEAGRPLAREDVSRVMDNLREQGFHLQMPPKLEPWLYQGNQD
jgi:uncharacterized protein YcgL (UPF0745 family)